MPKLLVTLLVMILVGCEATAIKNTTAIRTKQQLTPGIELPVQLPVAYYVDKKTPEKGVNFYGPLGGAVELVAGDMFAGAEPLSSSSKFHYLLKLKSRSSWDQFWGGWQSTVELTVVDQQGQSLHQGTVNKKSSGAGPYDYNAVHNALAVSVKELLIEFFNSQGQSNLAAAISAYQQGQNSPVALKELIPDASASSTGTGFFINQEGGLATAAHVVDECLYVEVMHKGQPWPATIEHASSLLDLAVIDTDYSNTHHALIGEPAKASLGKQVFVTGFPLSGILSDYPSLTVGNVSSMGGLKGAKGHFQFSAPVQPGNSGGAIVDYQGNLVGLVSSSLNQAMMLKESGTTAQNVNFGLDLALFRKFLDKNAVAYEVAQGQSNFEKASADAVEYTNQVLCYN